MKLGKGPIRLLFVLSAAWVLLVSLFSYVNYPGTGRFGGVPVANFFFWEIADHGFPTAEKRNGSSVITKDRLTSALVNAAIAEDTRSAKRFAEAIKNEEYKQPAYKVAPKYNSFILSGLGPISALWLLFFCFTWVRQGFAKDKENG